MNIRRLDWQNKNDRQAFIDLPWQLYNPEQWIPPIKQSIAAELSSDNLFFRHGRAAIFLAEDETQVLGRIVASVDKNLADPTVGHFGYFECVNDQAVADALLQAAQDWIREQGRSTLHGPVNLSIYHSYRLQTQGFETTPFLGEPRALSYYADLLTAAGYQQQTYWSSWDIPAQAMAPMQAYMNHKLQTLRETQQNSYSFKILDLADAEQELARLHKLAQATFHENYGFAEIDLAEFAETYQSLLFIFQRHADLFGMFYVNDLPDPIGFGFAYPDYADFFQAANGDPSGLSNYAHAQSKRMVFHSFAILPEFRHEEAPYSMFSEIYKRTQAGGYTTAIGALAKEGRTAYDQLGPTSRKYGIFALSLES